MKKTYQYILSSSHQYIFCSFLFICGSTYPLVICLSINLLNFLPIYLSINLYIYSIMDQPIHWSFVYLSTCSIFYQFIYLSIYISIQFRGEKLLHVQSGWSSSQYCRFILKRSTRSVSNQVIYLSIYLVNTLGSFLRGLLDQFQTR